MKYAEIERQYGSAVRRIAASYAPSGPERDDLEQEIALAIVEALPRFRDEASLKTYVLRIAHNCSIDRLRRQKNQPVDLNPAQMEIALATSANSSPERRALQRERFETLARHIRSLPLTLRQPLVLRLEGLSYEEIGAVLGVSTSNVGVRIHRARTTLSAQLKETL